MTPASSPDNNGGLSVLRTPQNIIIAHMIWHGILAVALLVLSWRIFTAEVLTILGQPTNLGKPVQYFAGALVLLPAIAGVIASWQLYQRNIQGRYITLMINFGGFALGIFAVLGVWGIYDSFELLVDGIMANATLTLGFAIAYGAYWLAGRLPQNRLREYVELSAIGLAMLTLIALLLASNIIDGILYILSTYTQPTAWLVTIITIIFFGLFWMMLMLGDYFDETPDQRTAWQGWLMLAPNIIGFLLFFAGPLLLSFYLSFTDSSVGEVPGFIGFQNYAELLALQIRPTTVSDATAQSVLDFGYVALSEFSIGGTRYVIGARDSLFWISMRNTLVFCLLLLPLAIVPALGMSLILNSKLPGVNFFRAIYFLPSVAAVVGTALIWRWLYQPTEGFINYSIRGIANVFGFADPNVQWLTDPNTVLISIVVLAAWQVVGYNTVLFLAGLQGIPNVLYEAAQIDGANRWQQFTNVTLPMLAPTTFFVIITTMVMGLQVFNEPYTLFPSQPIPENATTAVYYLYRAGFSRFEFGYASAVAWALFAIIFGLTLIQFRLNRNEAYE